MTQSLSGLGVDVPTLPIPAPKVESKTAAEPKAAPSAPKSKIVFIKEPKGEWN